VVDRKDMGSWLDGPGAVTRDQTGEYVGQRLGLPRTGPGSLGRFGRRLAALGLDWVACQLIAIGLFRVPPPWGGQQGFTPLAVFAVENLVLLSVAGATLGHRVMGLQLVALRGGRASVPQVLARTVLLCLAIPALIWDRDGRGGHDKVANTALLSTR
jgi:uncharacterized RDD family membrane protein YckC